MRRATFLHAILHTLHFAVPATAPSDRAVYFSLISEYVSICAIEVAILSGIELRVLASPCIGVRNGTTTTARRNARRGVRPVAGTVANATASRHFVATVAIDGAGASRIDVTARPFVAVGRVARHFAARTWAGCSCAAHRIGDGITNARLTVRARHIQARFASISPPSRTAIQHTFRDGLRRAARRNRIATRCRSIGGTATGGSGRIVRA